MVLESLVPVKLAERKPIEMLPLAFLYTTIGVFISMWIFPNNAGLTMVFFTVMATLPLMVHIIRFEEKKLFIRQFAEEHHKRVMPFFIFMFLGMVLAYLVSS